MLNLRQMKNTTRKEVNINIKAKEMSFNSKWNSSHTQIYFSLQIAGCETNTAVAVRSKTAVAYIFAK